jgi:hypothetical protein
MSKHRTRPRKRSLDAILAALLEAQPAMRAAYGPGRCIIATRIAIEVCRSRGVRAEPVAVSVDLRRGIAEGRLGFEPHGVPHGHWNAHLVAIVDGRRLLDLTLDTASSPTLGFHLRPIAIPAPPGFERGGIADAVVHGTMVRYEAHPEERGFLLLEDWNDRPERMRVQPLVERRLRSAS